MPMAQTKTLDVGRESAAAHPRVSALRAARWGVEARVNGLGLETR
jgi:hypothetical protein